MNIFRFALRALIFAAMIFAGAFSARAQATRTWVSGVGDDVNPCSRTAPCKTFAGAISKTAKGGEINCLDAGGFGAVTITKSITLDGTGAQCSILGSGVNGIIINITDAADAGVVRIRNLNINGANGGVSGIKILAANKVSVENTVIDGFIDGILAAPTASAQILIKDSSIRNNSGNGVNSSTAGSIVALSNVAVLFNGTGLAVASGGKIISFQNNTFFGNKVEGSPTSTAALK